MKNQEELVRACQEVGVHCSILGEEEALELIGEAIGRFSPCKTSGHLSIGNGAAAIPLERYEYSYSEYLGRGPAIVFFDQENHNRGTAVKISDGRLLGAVMSHSFGMEYFVTDPALSYLLAINWYAIEGAGAATQWMAQLEIIE